MCGNEMEAQVAQRYIVGMTCLQRLICAACAALVLAANAAVAAEATGAVAPAAQPPLLLIGPGDQVKIDVFGNPDLTTTINVADDGSIRMPLAGVVTVSGQSPPEAARRIEEALKSGQFLINPQVTLTVVQSLSYRVSVLGEVAKPGRYPIESHATVLDMIALAGGITEKGSDRIYILRTDSSGVRQRIPVEMGGIVASQGASSASIETLQAGDTLVVPKGTFLITGQVALPGEYRIEGDMILFEAIARAGGVTPLGSSSRVEVRRRGPNDQIVEVKSKKNLRIEPGDMIRVKERIF
jgi:polysaccharide biosynthesis/export protein